ncbi:hypothetical protein CAWG_01680 [Candida albicans WO-1]|uniref:Major facilitator superfamily (MFS) profile domain-containing protein n=1 Tax=Candida albicans (strain WO-1) TaxID=294748 RepID=C4YLG2_CANAW|nr:hypothetical protein CAWG_01680 [Candida albicans WO-1]
MSSVSSENNSGLFGTDVYDETKENKPKYEHEEGLEFGSDFDFDSEFEKYAAMGAAEKQSGAWMTNFKNLEFPLGVSPSVLVQTLGIFAAFCGILSGVDQSLISGASIGMDKSLHFNSHENSLVSSLMPLGAVAGSILLTPLQRFGRKKALMASCILYTIGAILCAAAPIPKELADGTFNNHRSRDVMYAGRFILGIGVGIEGGGVGVYITESVPSNKRGSLVSLYQLSIALGEVLGYAIAAIFYEVHGGWRFMVGSSLVFSTIVLIGLFFLPESPRYLVFKGKFGEAFNVFARLRDLGDRHSKIEFVQMVQAAEAERELRLTQNKSKVWFELVTIPRNRRALVYGIVMITLGQLTGINAVMYYLSTLMGRIGFSTKNSVFMSLVGGGSLLIGTIPAILYMDKFGRRVWGYNLVGFFVGLVLVGVGYSIDIETNLAAAEGVYLTGLILYMGFFGSYACLTWVVPAESFSLGTRSQGMTICSALLYLWAFTVTYNFNRMKVAMTYTGLTIGFYGGIAFLGFFYQVLFMPETKGKTLEEIDEIFEKPSRQLIKENLSGLKRFWGR